MLRVIAASIAATVIGCDRLAELLPPGPGDQPRRGSDGGVASGPNGPNGDQGDDGNLPTPTMAKGKQKPHLPKVKGAPLAPVPKGVVDLGAGVYPDGIGTDGASDFRFNVRELSPSRYRAAYRVSDDEETGVNTWVREFAKSVSYRQLSDKTFQWIPPEDCPSDMSCVYSRLVKRTRSVVAPFARLFRARADEQNLDALQTAEMILAFVQAVPYQIDEEPFGLKPPPTVLAERRGDCDSKSLLSWVLFDAVGIESVIIGSKAHVHAMIGVALPTAGKTFEWSGRRYAFAETTAIGSPIGHINPELLTPADWRVEYSGDPSLPRRSASR